jgi:hypothetical protein
MEKQKQQNLIKRYVFFFGICAGILLIGVVLSIPVKLEVHSVGEKPPFLFALFFSILLLVSAIGATYVSYLYWFQGVKTRKNLTMTIEQLANRYFIFRLPIYNPAFLFWFIRLTIPALAILVSGLFLLTVFSAF